MKRSLLAASAAAVLWALPAQSQTLTITEVDHVGNRITVSGAGIEKRVVDLDDAAISFGSQRIRVGDLQAGDQVVVDGALSGTRLSARSVRVVPPTTPPVGSSGETMAPGETVAPTEPTPRAPSPALTPGSPGTLQPGAPLPPPAPGGMERP